MYVSYLAMNRASAVSRSTGRFKVSGHLDIVQDRQWYGSGRMVDISRGGAGFICYSRLAVGARYDLVIDGIGVIPAEIIRSQNSYFYGAQFRWTTSMESRFGIYLEAKVAIEKRGQRRDRIR